MRKNPSQAAQIFQQGVETSIAQGLAGLDEMFERIATDFRGWPR
ncbi:hypothetical protein [Pseudomonas grimontii]|nr:hypothetical protein [Pseudomonas grimontii]MCS3513766.1 hypothetical protein [Pseudomonas grimontii]